MEYNFKPKDNYSVYAQSILSTQDRKIMSVLYLPIIGVNATQLYFVLWSDLEGDSVMSKILRPFSRLTNALDISINALNKACEKLEAVGLVQKYVKDNQYILVLKSPKTANAFFKNDVFRSMLKEKIGEEEYGRSKMYFAYKPSIPNGFINTSKSFQEVFQYPEEFTQKEDSELVERNEAKIELNYNFDQLYSGLVNVSRYAFTDKVKEAIGNIMYCYNVSIVDMRSIIMKAYNTKDLSIDIDKIRFFASNYYQERKQPLVSKETTNSKFSGEKNIDDFISFCESHTPFEFLEYKDGKKPIGPDLELLIELRTFNLPDSVVNVIIDYVLKRNDNILARAYVLKLASSLQRSKINNAYDAMMKLKYPSFNAQPTKKSSVKEDKVVETKEESIDELLAKIDRGEF